MIAIHTTSPSFIQRAAVVALLSFVFFLAMLIVFLIRQQMGYLILSAAFFVVNLFTLIGFLLQRKNVVSVFEDGLMYKGFAAAWTEIVSVDDQDGGLSIMKTNGSVIKIPRSIGDLGRLNAVVREKTHL